MSRILAFSGSARKESLNQKLVSIATKGVIAVGSDVTIVNLADYPMPIFNEDLEKERGLPDTTRQLKSLFNEHDGFLIASPEYNSAFSPLLKNTIDWCSRAEDPEEPPLQVFRGKIAAIMAVSPGSLGGLRGLVALRQLLQNIGVMVLPKQHAVPKGFGIFDDADQLKDPQLQQKIIGLGKEVAQMAQRVTSS